MTSCGSAENHVKPADGIKSFKVCALLCGLRVGGFKHARGQGRPYVSMSARGRDVVNLGIYV